EQDRAESIGRVWKVEDELQRLLISFASQFEVAAQKRNIPEVIERLVAGWIDFDGPQKGLLRIVQLRRLQIAKTQPQICDFEFMIQRERRKILLPGQLVFFKPGIVVTEQNAPFQKVRRQ